MARHRMIALEAGHDDESQEPPSPATHAGRTPENAPQPADFDPRRRPGPCCGPPAPARLRRSTATAAIPLLAGQCRDRADGSPLLLVSRLATHTANLEADGRASRCCWPRRGRATACASARHRARHVCPSRPRRAGGRAHAPPLSWRAIRKRSCTRTSRDFAFWRMSDRVRASQWRLCPRRRSDRRPTC